MLKRATIALAVLAIISTETASALDAGSVKRAADIGGNWLIGQFDLKTRGFGSTTAPEHLAMSIKALSENPRDYKEANGPYFSEPVKVILSKIDVNGHVNGTVMNETEAILWIITGLKATKNDAYKATIDKLRTRIKELPKQEYPKFESAHLRPTSVTADSMRNALAAILKAGEEGKKEITIDGQPVKWAEVLGESLIKLQQPDGSFGADIPASAMALYALNLCYKNM